MQIKMEETLATSKPSNEEDLETKAEESEFVTPRSKKKKKKKQLVITDFLSRSGKLLARYTTGASSKDQKEVIRLIKRRRHAKTLPLIITNTRKRKEESLSSKFRTKIPKRLRTL